METREQKLAQSYDRHLAITANAGSGKTRVLVDRYIKLLLSGVDPRNIVAITFTRKAAAEMLSRITDNISQMSKNEQSPVILKKLERIRERLTNPRISTIHSFCSSILRDYPIEAGVAPNFTELSMSDLIKIRNNAIQGKIEEWLDENNPDRKQKLLKLIRLYGKTGLELFLEQILSKREIFDKLNTFYSQSNQDIIYNRNQTIFSILLSLFYDLNDYLNIFFTSIDSNSLAKKSKESLDIASSYHDTFNIKLGVITNENKCNDYSEIFNCLQYIINNLFTGDLRLRSIFAKKILINNDYLNTDISSCLEIILNFIESFKNDKYETDLIDISRILFELAFEIKNTIDEEKELQSGLDFDDLMLKAVQVLRNPDVILKIRRKIKYLLIDEFQDTNSLQYEIVRLLVPDLDNFIIAETDENLNPKTNLLIVGDEKQSIYSFRNADVRVFAQAKYDIAKVNQFHINNNTLNKDFNTPFGKIASNSDEESSGIISLSSTFRLQPAIAIFINDIFSRVMKANTEFDIAYNPFICGRNSDEILNISNNNISDISNLNFGNISVLISERPYNNNSSENYDDNGEETENIKEAELLVNHIANLINTNEQISFKDIAILARSRNNFEQLIDALKSNNLPYILHSGIGFYESQEIKDLIAFLTFLHNTNNDIALAAILKSPYFSLSDTDLFNISREEKCIDFWAKLNNYVHNYTTKTETDKLENNNINRSLNILNELLEIASNLPIPILINKILEKTGYYGIISNKTGKHQMEANINKLIQLAREFENRGFRNLYDFVDELQFMHEEAIKEGEATYITDENAINILTIHSAKGLEFPVAILYDTNAKTGRTPNAIISSEFGINYLLNIIDDGIIKSLETPFWTLSKYMTKVAEDAEEKRILYVALTRAKDQLFISTTLAKNKDGNYRKFKGFWRLIANGIGINEELNTIFDTNNSIQYQNNMMLLNNNNYINAIIKYQINIITEETSVPIIEISNNSERIIPNILLDSIDTNEDSVYFSATKFNLFDENKYEYIANYLLGLPSSDDKHFEKSFSSDNQDNDEILGTLSGTLIHSTLENIKQWLMPDGTVNENILKEIVETIIYNSEINIQDTLRNRIITECKSIASTNLIKLYSEYFKEAKIEYALYLPIYNHFINGKFDLLIKNPNNELEIWDWKTNKINSKSDIDFLVEKYRQQLSIYAYLLSLKAPNQSNYTTRLCFTRLASKNANNDDWTRTITFNSDDLIKIKDNIFNKIQLLEQA